MALNCFAQVGGLDPTNAAPGGLTDTAANQGVPLPVQSLTPGEWWAVTNGMAPGDLAGLANVATQGGALSPAALAAIKAGLTADDVSAIAAMAAQVLAVQAQSTLVAQPMTQMSGGITVANPVLNINIGGLTNAEVGLAAIGQTASDFWTGAYFPYSYSNTIDNLLWSDKTVSGINVLISNAPGDRANGAIDPMLSTYAYIYGGDITVTLTGVPAGTYALYLYGHGPTTDASIFSVTSPSNSLGTLSTGTNWQSSTWTAGAQYVVFPGLSVSSGQPVSVDVHVHSLDYALISGLQLLPYSNVAPDLLHDTITSRVPFMGVPFVVTGIIEAEQFDLGGPGTGYHANDNSNATTDYRVCNLCITTNNPDPMGGGFCVDELRANEWLSYSIDVRVGQTYAIEPRVAGIGTGGTFSISFSTAAQTNYTNATFTVPTTSWTNLLAKNIPLRTGTNTMTVTMLSNGTGGAVARLNYISIYPSWNEGLPAGVAYTTSVPASALSTNVDWLSASNNSVVIQNQIDSLTNHGGGTVVLPAGTYCLASRLVPDETQWAQYNTALYVYANNVQILGSNTTLVAHDRDVTLLCVGAQFQSATNIPGMPLTNFVLSGVTMQGTPHWAYDGTNPTNSRTWEPGWFNPARALFGDGDLMCVGWPAGTVQLNNILITNCVFENPACLCADLTCVANVLWRSNNFVFPMDGTNGALFTSLTNAVFARSNTVAFPGGPAVFAGTVVNANFLECAFRAGDTNQSSSAVARIPDGLVWDQGGGGNWFVGRTVITNYGLEAIQWNSGPAAIAQSSLSSAANTPSTCAFNDAEDESYGSTVTTNAIDLSFAFVGNVVSGGRQGVEGGYAYPNQLTNVAYLVVSGNTVSLLPWATNDTYGAAALVTVVEVDRLDVAGNTLVSGDMPVRITGGFTNAIILQNNFAGAKLCGIDDESQGGQVASSLVLKNTISCGTGGTVSGLSRPPFHLQAATYADGEHWFLIQNTYVDTNGLPVNPLWYPSNLPVQYQP
ncbi:MAG: carbohydrate-binding protein [Limisphaerales bacterium]